MKIGEVAAKAGVTNRAIRYYEELKLIKSDRLSNNYREYSEEALDKVKFISRAKKLGFSIYECSSLISLFDNEKRKSFEVREIAIRKREELKKQIKELKDLEKSLEWLIKKCPGNDKPNCPIIDELAN